MSSSLTNPIMPETCSPAPYGKACIGCARAKCKCYTMSDRSGKCERCHRLGKVCQPAVSIRKKRKAHSHSSLQPTPPQNNAAGDLALDATSTARLEEKLDSLVSLLRSQGVSTDQSPTQNNASPSRVSSNSDTPSTSDFAHQTNASPPSLDTECNNIILLSPLESPLLMKLVQEAIAAHIIWGPAADEQLDNFRRSFLSHLPVVDIPLSVTADELRRQKPFLWLVIMTLSAKSLASQFAMEETIWSIVSRLVVAQRMANLDLLLGLICFGSWSHYFKKDKPFMVMLTQLAVAVALELNLHKDSRPNVHWRGRFGRMCSENAQKKSPRTLEERRTMLALWFLTSSTWSSYRKTEPMAWSSYLSSCVRVLTESSDCEGDAILVVQVRSHLVGNQITCTSFDDDLGDFDEGAVATPPPILTKVLLRQLSEIRQGLPPHVQSHRTVQLNLLSAEILVRATCLNAAPPTAQERATWGTNTRIQRLRDLEATLSAAERWKAVFFENFPIEDWIGISVDVFSQFTQCIVVVFRLTMIGSNGDEPGWDSEDVRRRIDVFEILDQMFVGVSQVGDRAGIIDDAPAGRQGFWKKTPMMLRMIKTLLLAEVPPDMDIPTKLLSVAIEQQQQQNPEPLMHTPESMDQSNDRGDMLAKGILPDDIIMGMAEEPWLSDLWGPGWDAGQQSPFLYPVDFSFGDQM